MVLSGVKGESVLNRAVLRRMVETGQDGYASRAEVLAEVTVLWEAIRVWWTISWDSLTEAVNQVTAGLRPFLDIMRAEEAATADWENEGGARWDAPGSNWSLTGTAGPTRMVLLSHDGYRCEP